MNQIPQYSKEQELVNQMVEYIKKECKQKQVSELSEEELNILFPDSHQFMQQLKNTQTHNIFGRLIEIIQRINKLNQQKKQDVINKITSIQNLIYQYKDKQRTVKIKINKKLDQWCHQTFSAIAQLQVAAERIDQGGMCGGGDRVARFDEKYQEFLRVTYIWEVLSDLESAILPLQFDEDNLKQYLYSKVENLFNNNKNRVEIIEKIVEKRIEVPKEIIIHKKEDNLQIKQELEQLQKKVEFYINLHRCTKQLYGINCDKNIIDSVRDLKLMNEVESNNLLAYQYVEGVNFNQDFKLANQYYKLSLQKNDNTALYQYGKNLIIQKNKSQKGFQLMRKAADQGHIEACIDIGMILNSGIQQGKKWIIQQDKVQADIYLSKGVKTARGNYYLGLTRDFKEESIQYFKQAIDLGSIDAIYDLGKAYELLGNEEEAIAQYFVGANLKNKKCIEALLPYLQEEAIEQDQVNVFQSYLKQVQTHHQSDKIQQHLETLETVRSQGGINKSFITNVSLNKL